MEIGRDLQKAVNVSFVCRLSFPEHFQLALSRLVISMTRLDQRGGEERAGEPVASFQPFSHILILAKHLQQRQQRRLRRDVLDSRAQNEFYKFFTWIADQPTCTSKSGSSWLSRPASWTRSTTLKPSGPTLNCLDKLLSCTLAWISLMLINSDLLFRSLARSLAE